MLNLRTVARVQDAPIALPDKQKQPVGQLLKFRSPGAPFVRRRLSPQAGRAMEILGHAIEYLADEYVVDNEHRGPLGSADPRVEAIQTLKALNRLVYYSAPEAKPVFRRIRRWFIGVRNARKGA